MAGIDVHGHSPTDVGRRFSPDEPSGAGVAEFRTIGVAWPFMDVEDFQARSVRVDVREMDGVAMP